MKEAAAANFDAKSACCKPTTMAFWAEPIRSRFGKKWVKPRLLGDSYRNLQFRRFLGNFSEFFAPLPGDFALRLRQNDAAPERSAANPRPERVDLAVWDQHIYIYSLSIYSFYIYIIAKIFWALIPMWV